MSDVTVLMIVFSTVGIIPTVFFCLRGPLSAARRLSTGGELPIMPLDIF
jgi:hypothetical protein